MFLGYPESSFSSKSDLMDTLEETIWLPVEFLIGECSLKFELLAEAVLCASSSELWLELRLLESPGLAKMSLLLSVLDLSAELG